MECPVCNSVDSFTNKNNKNKIENETYCRNCGYVIYDFDYNNKDLKKMGPPSSYKYHDKGGCSHIYITQKNFDFNDNKFSKLNKLLKFNKYVRVSGRGDKFLSECLNDFSIKCSSLMVPNDIKEIGYKMLHSYNRNEKMSGKKIEYLSGSLIYLLARIYKLPITIKEVLDTISLKKEGRAEKRRRVLIKNYKKL